MRHLTFGSCLVVALLAPACSSGPKLLPIKGQLNYQGQPYIAKHNGSLSVKFTPIVEAEKHYDTYPAEVNREDGSFVVKGRTGNGIPAGKYRISINQRVMDAPGAITEMNERFSAKESRIVRDISDETPIVIDLAKPEG